MKPRKVVYQAKVSYDKRQLESDSNVRLPRLHIHTTITQLE